MGLDERRPLAATRCEDGGQDDRCGESPLPHDGGVHGLLTGRIETDRSALIVPSELVARMSATPGLTPVTVPLLFTMAVLAFEDVQVRAGGSVGCLFLSNAAIVNVHCRHWGTDSHPGRIWIRTAAGVTGAGGSSVQLPARTAPAISAVRDRAPLTREMCTRKFPLPAWPVV